MSVAVPDREAILPRILTRAEVTAAATSSGAGSIVWLPVVGELVVGFVVEHGKDQGLIRSEQLAALQLAPPALLETSLQNLRRQLPQIGWHQFDQLGRVVAGDRWEACTLLATKFWTEVAAGMQGELVIAVPTPTVVLGVDSADAEGMEALVAVTVELLQDEEETLLSTDFFTWRGDHWEVYEDPDE